jgi:hypothetical protein
MNYPNITACVSHEVLLVAQSTQRPTNDEWDAIITVVKDTKNKPPKAVIISSDGGYPNSMQRKKLRDTLRNLQTSEKSPPMAMISDVIMVRVGLTALQVFLPNAPLAFSTKQWKEIAAHLRLSKEELLLVAETLNKLRQNLSLQPLPMPSALM